MRYVFHSFLAYGFATDNRTTVSYYSKKDKILVFS
jgi:hypothetical protein